MVIRVSGILMNEKLSSISKMFDKTIKDSVTSNIRFVLYSDFIQMQAMNERITYTEDIFCINTDIACGQSFSLLVDAGTLISFFKTHKGDVEMEVKNDYSLVFKYKNGSFSTTWLEDKAFPEFFYPKGNHLRVHSSSFIPFMKRSFAFVGTDEFRPAICTVLINVKKDYIDIVSTDMFRLFINRKEMELIQPVSEEKSIMLSEVAASILYQFISDKDVEIAISTDGVRTFLCFENIMLSDMNVEQKYPNYEYVCNKFGKSSSVKFDRDQLISILNSMTLINNVVFVKVDTDTVTVMSEDMGNRKMIMESTRCEIMDGPGFTFYISKDNILSSVKSLIKGEVIMEWSEQYKMLKMFNPKYESTYVLNQTLSNL